MRPVRETEREGFWGWESKGKRGLLAEDSQRGSKLARVKARSGPPAVIARAKTPAYCRVDWLLGRPRLDEIMNFPFGIRICPAPPPPARMS